MSKNNDIRRGLLTIVLTSYNYARFIGEAVQSVIDQTYPEWRLIIFDNRSTDNTLEVLEPFLKDPRISLVVRDKNIGAINNNILALRSIDTEFVASLQADDFLDKTFVEMAIYQFHQHSNTPFVFFNWHHFQDNSKTINYHNRHPFSPSRSGPLRIGPFLTICNFVPFHMAVFRTQCLINFIDRLAESPLAQVGEQFLFKMIEDSYGCGCYSGTLGGYWRRHGRQLTVQHMDSLVADIEEPIERYWYATKAPNPDYVNVFLALVTFVRHCSHVNFITAVDWLINRSGTRYAESFGIPITQERDRLQSIALTVALKYTTYTLISLLEENDLERWLSDMNCQPTLEGLRSKLESVMAREGEAFLNSAEINDICAKVESKWKRAASIYGRWIERRLVGEGWAEIVAERWMKRWWVQPTFHLVIWCEPGQRAALADTLESIDQQFYNRWGVSVLAPFECPDASFAELPNLEWVKVEANADAALRGVLEASALDWFTLLEPGDRLAPHALLKSADYINRDPAWRFIYFDEDRLDARGQRCDPVFRPDFDPELLLATHYLGDCCLMQRDSALVDGALAYVPGVTTFQAALRTLQHYGPPAIGHIADVLYHRSATRTEVADPSAVAWTRRKLIEQYLANGGVAAAVEEALLPGTWRMVYQHHRQPKISIIILAKDALDWLDRCLRRLLSQTVYPDYEVLIVDCGSEVDDTLDLYAELEERYPDRFRVIAAQGPFLISAYRNQGANQARGDVLVFLSASALVVQPQWLERLLNHALRDEVGIVGARMTTPDRTNPFIYGTAQLLGLRGVAGPLFSNLTLKAPGPLGRAQLDQTVSAISAECLAVRRPVFKALGGFEESFVVAHADTDLCLRASERGYRTVWTPFANLAWLGEYPLATGFSHDEIVKHTQADADRMFERWSPRLGTDPAYNPNLSLAEVHEVEADFAPGWDTAFHDRPRLLGFPGDESGCGLYRVYAPLWLLEHQARAECTLVRLNNRPLELAELERLAPDTIFYQSTVADLGLAAMRRYRRFHPSSFKVFDLDDLKHNVPDANSLKERLIRDMKYRHRMALRECDRLIVSTEPLADACRSWIDDIRVVPNRLEWARWGRLQNRRRIGPKPRIGWAGAQQHHGDLAFIADVVRQTQGEVDWVFFGMCLDELRPFVKEVHDWVHLNDYPAKLASLDLDLAVAPLEQHPFNEAKSNLRVLEHGILGRPMVCTDIYPYRNAPVKRVPNETGAWIDAIRERIYDLDAAEREGDALRAWVLEDYILDNHTDEWLSALRP